MEAGSIKAIDRGSVHRICSGQVVLTLATAVKELVENSIDAGATIVEVKLREYGSELIDVSDNGLGVEEKNFEGLTLKHHTSKLEDFSDLINVETFGFRGEALSSLCALSVMSVVTRHKDVEVGSKLEYDNHGKVSSRSSVARQIGTTVTLQNLFYTLPVRHKEFQRNLKKEFVKMVHVLNAYCLINTGVRITCTNQTGKGNRTTVVSSKGNQTVKENISNIFGPKQTQSILEFKQHKPTEEVSSEYGIKLTDGQTELFKIEGHISKCEHGQGRSSADRQFYFINKRPCDHSKLSKLVNEVYHQYNRHQYPFVALSITIQKESVDVNVTPDKRQVFIENEKILLAVIKTSLIEMFEPTASVYNVNTCTLQNLGNKVKTSPFKQRESSELNCESPVLSKHSVGSAFNNLKRTFSSSFTKEEESSISPVKEQQSKQRRLDSFVIKSKTSDNTEEMKESFIETKPIITTEVKDSQDISVTFETNKSLLENTDNQCVSPNSFIVNHEKRELTQTDSESGISSSQDQTDSQSSVCVTISSDSDVQHLSQEICQDHSERLETEEVILLDPDSDSSKNAECQSIKSDKRESKNSYLCSPATSCVQEDCLNDEVDRRLKATVNTNLEVSEVDCSSPNMIKEPEPYLQVTCFDEMQDHKRTERTVTFDFKGFRDRVQKRKNRKSEESFCRTFRAKISPTDNKAAEEELQKEISKDMFKEMEILGQFNLGFIISKLREDLFIVDQHATDEKYNFEMLQRHTVIQSQKMIHPQSLELTSSNEIILMESIEVFRKNGFDFIVDEQGDPTQRVKLISTPVSKNWTFGKDDIEELIFMLTDSPGVMCRPSRVRQMFASRSCRKSIMIGTALNKAEMKKLVEHMGQIDQPWNCPHGRPTMRHLINLNMVPR
ncbi:mismatch repair endonuclease PMS2-like [Mytilus trossulus]|uniref:mismatch repair endonuclease PMS2-like n=1 Tax=Mytilus trossulus TaxID=6551 RepID=UPI003004A88F